MIYSVWDHAKRVYRYYDDGAIEESVNAPKPKHLRSGALGAAPDQAAWRVPPGAKPAGEGPYPWGRIAVKGSPGPMSGLDINLDIGTVALIGTVGLVVWEFFLKRG